MKAMLTSFGLAQDAYWQSKGEDPYVRNNSLFYGSPPFFPTHTDCNVDLTPFILYDKVVIDQGLLDEEDKYGFRKGSILEKDILRELDKNEVVEPRKFKEDTENHLSLLEQITTKDIVSQSSAWMSAVHKSALRWNTYLKRTQSVIGLLAKTQPLVERPLSMLASMYCHRLCHYFPGFGFILARAATCYDPGVGIKQVHYNEAHSSRISYD